MPYRKNIPRSNQNISDSCALIRNNFLEIYNYLGHDHTGFDIPTAGNHFQVQFPIYAGTLPYTTPAGEVALHSKTSLLSGIPELVFVPENSTEAREFTSSRKAYNGATMLPSGIIMRWGRVNVDADTEQEIVYPVIEGIPAFSEYPISFQLSRTGTIASRGNVYLRLSAITSFTVYNSSEEADVYYVVMGY